MSASSSMPRTDVAFSVASVQQGIGQLATELLHLVFTYLPLRTLVLISRTCRRWRAIILAHPTYTSVIQLPRNASKPRLEFFLLQASRAARSPQVDIDASGLEGARSASVARALHQLFGHAKSMRVVMDADAWESDAHALMGIRSQQLERLHIGVANVMRSGRAYSSLPLNWNPLERLLLPSLRTLSLDDVPLPSESSIPWLAHVTDLRLDVTRNEEARILDLGDLHRVFPALSLLRAVGNFTIVPPTRTSTLNLQRLSLHTYDISALWPELQPHIASVRHVEVGWLSNAGVDAIVRHLRTPVHVAVTIEPSYTAPSEWEEEVEEEGEDDLGKVRFTTSGACGKTFSLVCGKPDEDSSASEVQVHTAAVSTPPAAQDSPTHLDVDATALARHTHSLRLDVDLWDVACRTGVEYSAVKTLTLVWPATACGQLMMPMSGICAYSKCSALRCLRLERELESCLDRRAWVDLEEVWDFVRSSFTGVDSAMLALDSYGIDLLDHSTTERLYRVHDLDIIV